MTTKRLFVAFALLTCACVTAADDPDPSKPSTEPKDVPLQLSVRNKAQEAYDLDTRGDPIFKYQDKIQASEKTGRYLPASRVEMELEIKNTGTGNLEIWVSGDATEWTYDLKGNGARSLVVKTDPPKGTIAPKAVVLKPGKSHMMPLDSLAYGFRNETKRAYLTEMGLYELAVTFRTGVWPAPTNSKQLPRGFGEVQLKSAPLKFRVVRPS